MKFIRKAGEPAQLRQWRLENQPTPQVLRYANVPGRARTELRTCLLREQGYLCAYTMIRVRHSDRGHIEHVQPRSRDTEREIDYFNLVYCHPGESAPRCEFGAHAKDDAPTSPDIFVSPLDANCETRFVYQSTGAIAPRDPGDLAATQTIAMLRLNHDALEAARRAAIRGLAIFSRSSRPLSAADARKRARALLRQDEKGMFTPFAPALHQFVSKYAERKEAEQSARARAARLARDR